MPEIDELRKSLVDVGLGALAFFCSVDRRAVPLTRTVCVLSFCFAAWIILAFSALFSPTLIGGNTPTERFSELAPVLVLSSPLLWGALRQLQILLETYDSLAGTVALISDFFDQISGVFDQPFKLRNSRVLDVFQSTCVSQESQFSLVHRYVQLDNVKGKANEFENRILMPKVNGMKSHKIDQYRFRWTTEVLPIAGEIFGCRLPVQRNSSAFVTEHYRYEHDDDEEITNGNVCSLPRYYLRIMRHWSRTISRRYPPHAVFSEYFFMVDNSRCGYLSPARELRYPPLLYFRRYLLGWPAAVLAIFQGVVSAAISGFDAVIGECLAFVFVLLFERLHPLALRRAYAKQLFSTSALVVPDVVKMRGQIAIHGQARFYNDFANVSIGRVLISVFGRRSDLAVRAFVMLHAGVYWRNLKYASNRRAVHTSATVGYGRQAMVAEFPSIPLLAIDCMERPNVDTELSVSGEMPMVLLTPDIVDCVWKRFSEIDSVPNDMLLFKFASLLREDEECASLAKKSCLNEFCELGWIITTRFIGCPSMFDLNNNASRELQELFSEMLDLHNDCHAAALQAVLSRERAETNKSDVFRHRLNLDDLISEVEKIEQHELLVACHKQETRAIAWLFVEDSMNGNWESWHRWCVFDALDIVSLVWQGAR